MSLKTQIDQDLKQAMLSGDKTLTTTLRGIKSAILYVEVAKNSRDEGLSDTEIIDVLSKEAKKRQESADLYAQGGNTQQQQAELKEKTVIEQYLPPKLSEVELAAIIDEVIKQSEGGPQPMGQIIGVVKQKTGPQADGALIAKIVKEKLNS
jgi:uncharacterized protein